MSKGGTNILRMFFIGVFCYAFFSLSFGTELTPVAIHGRLHIKGNRFVDQYDKPVTLHGMSNYNWADQGTQYYNRIAITRMAKEWKCTVIRCVLLPKNIGSQTHLCDTVIRACIDNGIYVIINWHTIGGSLSDAEPCANWMAGFAKRWGNTPNIMYEPWNEPTSTSWKDIKGYMQKSIDAIRPIDPENIIIAGNPTWSQRLDQCAQDPITTTKNVAYTLHFYAASPEHYVTALGKNVRAALDSGLAVFCTEYGSCEYTGGGKMDTVQTRKWYDFLDSNGIGCTAWSISALGETSAAFFNGTSATNWTDANIKPSGIFVRAYIQSQYPSLMTGISPDNFNIARRDRGEGIDLSAAGDVANTNIFTLNGSRVSGATRGVPAKGMYIQIPANGKAKGMSIVR